MATAAQLIDQALRTLQPEPGFQTPSRKQLEEADVRARIATARALDDIADHLATLNRQQDTTIRPAIHHSA